MTHPFPTVRASVLGRPGLRGLGRGAAGVRTDREQLADRACGRGAAVRHAAGRALAGGRRAPWRRYDAGGRLQRPRMNTAQIKPDGTVLVFDVGARRIGVAVRSAERSVGKACVRTFSSRWSPYY